MLGGQCCCVIVSINTKIVRIKEVNTFTLVVVIHNATGEVTNTENPHYNDK